MRHHHSLEEGESRQGKGLQRTRARKTWEKGQAARVLKKVERGKPRIRKKVEGGEP